LHDHFVAKRSGDTFEGEIVTFRREKFLYQLLFTATAGSYQEGRANFIDFLRKAAGTNRRARVIPFGQMIGLSQNTAPARDAAALEEAQDAPARARRAARRLLAWVQARAFVRTHTSFSTSTARPMQLAHPPLPRFDVLDSRTVRTRLSASLRL